MSDHLVRVGHLKALQRERGWNDSELARQCGKTPQQVYSWFDGKRNIGERLARDLEERLNLPRYTLDGRESTQVREVEPPPFVTKGLHPSVTTRSTEVPVLAWAGVLAMLTVENSTLKHKAAQLETFVTASSRAKFVQMPDDSMSPEISQGDHILFDPAVEPRAGDVVLVAVESGEHFIRYYRPRTAAVFEATPGNPAYQALTSQSDGAQVLAVMLEHRRYRRAV